MKKWSMIIIFVFITLVFCGCKDNTSTITVKDISTFKNKIENSTKENLPPLYQEGYGIRLFDEKGNFVSNKSITYSGDYMNYFVSFMNATKSKEKIGLVLIVDGEINPFFVDGNTDEKLVYEMDFKENTLINIPIRFKPLFKNIEKHKVFFTMINGLDEKPGDKIPHISLFQMSMFKNLELGSMDKGKDIKLNNSFVTNLRDDAKDIAMEGSTVVLLGGEKDVDEYNINDNITMKNKDEKFTVQVLGCTEDTKYSTILFLDNQPIKIFEESASLNWQANKEQMLKYTFDLSKFLTPGEHMLYAITIPIDGEITRLYNSSKIILNVK